MDPKVESFLFPKVFILCNCKDRKLPFFTADKRQSIRHVFVVFGPGSRHAVTYSSPQLLQNTAHVFFTHTTGSIDLDHTLKHLHKVQIHQLPHDAMPMSTKCLMRKWALCVPIIIWKWSDQLSESDNVMLIWQQQHIVAW